MSTAPIILASTTDTLRVVTTEDSSIDCAVSYFDLDASVTPQTVTPGKANTLITTATAGTDIVDAPSASTTSRGIADVEIRNRHASAFTVVTVIHRQTGSTDVEIAAFRLSPGFSILYDARHGFYLAETATGTLAAVAERVHTTPDVGATYVAVLDRNVSNSCELANTATLIPGLEFPVTPGKSYRIRATIKYTANATTTGTRFSFFAPFNGDFRYSVERSLTTTTKTTDEGCGSGQSTPGLGGGATNATSAATDSNICIIEGFLVFGGRQFIDSSLVTLCFSSESAFGTVTVLAGSRLEWMRVL